MRRGGEGVRERFKNVYGKVAKKPGIYSLAGRGDVCRERLGMTHEQQARAGPCEEMGTLS